MRRRAILIGSNLLNNYDGICTWNKKIHDKKTIYLFDKKIMNALPGILVFINFHVFILLETSDFGPNWLITK